MPQRTNDFQRMMTNVYRQWASAGFTVRESVMLKEGHADSNREIDILIEKQECGMALRIAVECRGRSRKDSVTWIDELIGKYIDLEVSEVIAVSASGCSRALWQKASAHRIKVVTPQKLTTIDLNHEFKCLGIRLLRPECAIDGLTIKTEPKCSLTFSFDEIVFARDGTVVGTMQEYCQAIADSRIPAVTQLVMERFINGISEDIIQNLRFSIQIDEHETRGFFIRGDAGQKYQITQALFKVQCRFLMADVPVERYIVDDRKVVTGRIAIENGQNLVVTSVEGPPGHPHVFWDETTSSTSKTSKRRKKP